MTLAICIFGGWLGLVLASAWFQRGRQVDAIHVRRRTRGCLLWASK